MSLKKNFSVIGKHAFLSPSTYNWLDYDEEKLRRVYFQKQQSALGDKLHVYAQQAIELKQKQPDNGTTVAMYINDGIGFRLTPEFPLVYSDDCFGTADTCGLREEKWPDGRFLTLRISDLKTGTTPASMKQLLIYAALFCFDFKFDPRQLRFILRIYQNDAIQEHTPDAAEIQMIMSRVKTQAELIAYLREED